jgi:hypothetical protein
MDKRERAGERGDFFTAINEGTMKLLIVLENDEGEEVETWLPFKYEACDVCDGKGKHVDPAIDSHGLSREDFDEDPDFEESYFRGDYDVTCHQCGGKNVYPVLDEERFNGEQREAMERLRDMRRMDAEYAAECRAERAFCGDY